VQEFKKAADHYPNYETVMRPADKYKVCVQLNPVLLINLLKAMLPVTEETIQKHVNLYVEDGKTQIRIESSNGDQSAIGFLMPMQA